MHQTQIRNLNGTTIDPFKPAHLLLLLAGLLLKSLKLAFQLTFSLAGVKIQCSLFSAKVLPARDDFFCELAVVSPKVLLHLLHGCDAAFQPLVLNG